MKQIEDTKYYVFSHEHAEALKNGLLEQIESAGPMVPSDCGPMVRIGDEKDVVFLEQALG